MARLLLETSAVDGLLLEDGTGVLLLEAEEAGGGGGGQYSTTITADSPSVYFRLDEPSGSFVDQMGGNSGTGNGTLTRAVAGAISDGNAACQFDGSTAYISIADETAMDVADGPFTIEAWINGTVWTSGTNIRSILGKGTNAPLLFVNPSGGLVLAKRFVADIVTSNVTMSTGTWYHVVATKNGSAVKLYINGVDRTGTVTNQTLADNTTAAGIGSELGTGATSPFSGVIDELAVYKSVLTQSQVQAHYNAAFDYGLDRLLIAMP